MGSELGMQVYGLLARRAGEDHGFRENDDADVLAAQGPSAMRAQDDLFLVGLLLVCHVVGLLKRGSGPEIGVSSGTGTFNGAHGLRKAFR